MPRVDASRAACHARGGAEDNAVKSGASASSVVVGVADHATRGRRVVCRFFNRVPDEDWLTRVPIRITATATGKQI